MATMSALAGGRNRAERHSFGHGRHDQRSFCVRHVRQVRHLFDDAQKVWRLHDDGSGLAVDCCFEPRGIHLPVAVNPTS